MQAPALAARVVLSLLPLYARVIAGDGEVFISLTLLPSTEWSDSTELCPGVTVEMKCTHTRTNIDPSWRVKGNGLSNVGLARIGEGGIPNHSISEDTDTVDVLRVRPVLSEFDGFTYLCLYSVHGKDVNSETIRLNVTRVPAEVENLTVKNLTSSMAIVSWHHPNQCDFVQAFQVSLTHVNSKVVLSNQSYSASVQTLPLPSLHPSTDYVVVVTVTLKSGQVGTPKLYHFKTTKKQAQLVSDGSDLNCGVSASFCIFVFVPTVLIPIVLIMVCSMVVCFVSARWTRYRHMHADHYPAGLHADASQHVVPVARRSSSAWQPQYPLSLRPGGGDTSLSSSAYHNTLYESDLMATMEDEKPKSSSEMWTEDRTGDHPGPDPLTTSHYESSLATTADSGTFV